jgi:pimeloyl-ACP methyl ester carboxylesterase
MKSHPGGTPFTFVFFAVALAWPGIGRGASLADFPDYSLRNSSGFSLLPGRLFTPPEALGDTATPRPMMVYLHGGGANGTNNTTQIAQTPDHIVEEAKQRGAYLYVPQAPSGWGLSTTLERAMTMIDRAVTQLHADPDRVYISGYSNGGGGTLNLLSRYPGRFAAAMIVSAVAPGAGFSNLNVLEVPLIAVHARDDATVSVARSRELLATLLSAARHPQPTYPAAGGSQTFLAANPAVDFHRQVLEGAPTDGSLVLFNLRSDLDLMYYEPPLGGHTGLLGLYWEPRVYGWLFSHSLAVPEPSGAALATAGLAVPAARRRRSVAIAR